ncbi:MAG: carboxymuconolactone decarboxylase family protein [Dehalococcoidia bacterium]|nr:carboxymuconolactone decarboxylase family protein [Dehalococcoidia bacterium]
MESQVDLNDERVRLFEKLGKTLPGLWAAETAAFNEVYKDGALSLKAKRLMALGIGLGAGCTNCILGQTKRALEAGATRDEILETISVVVAMRGTTGVAESLRVIKLLEELGLE